MDIFEAVTKARRDHGYYAKDYTRYGRHARNMARGVRKREGTESSLFMIYVSENCMAKHFLARGQKAARKHIRKAQRASSAAEVKAPALAGSFSLYYEGVGHMRQGRYEEAAALLIKSRQAFLCCREICREIDIMLDHCSRSAGAEIARPERVARRWHDIELHFGDEEEAQAFFSGDAGEPADDCFESVLKGKILRVEGSRKKLMRLMEKGARRLRCMQAKSRVLLDEARELNAFISKNYIRSDFAAGFERDAAEMSEFLAAVASRSRGDMGRDQLIRGFRVPDTFREAEDAAEALRHSEELDTPAVRARLLEELEKLVSVREGSSARIPLFPVFYDLAYDFVDYPGAKEGGSRISGIVSKLSSFSFKK